MNDVVRSRLLILDDDTDVYETISGIAGLVQPARLPFSEMKIDKSFVMVVRRSDAAQRIAIAIVGLAHALGLDVTAEGVEEAWTLEFLREIGCNHAHGYLISRPMLPDAIAPWLEQWHDGQERF